MRGRAETPSSSLQCSHHSIRRPMKRLRRSSGFAPAYRSLPHQRDSPGRKPQRYRRSPPHHLRVWQFTPATCSIRAQAIMRTMCFRHVLECQPKNNSELGTRHPPPARSRSQTSRDREKKSASTMTASREKPVPRKWNTLPRTGPAGGGVRPCRNACRRAQSRRGRAVYDPADPTASSMARRFLRWRLLPR
jgi:hypothetical protein